MAVGDSAGNHVGGLVERWNGTKWSVVPSPRKGTANTFTSVACVSPTWCAAVGLFAYKALRPNVSSALAEVWNGKAWRVVPARNPALNSSVVLYAIDCVSSTWCMAGGYGPTGALIEHWNGQAWTIMAHPSGARTAPAAAVWGVSCVSRTACVAAGYDLPLAESWNGKVWSRMSTLDGWDEQGAPPQYFSGVSCITASLCKAVGDGTAIATSG